jgi:DnaJ-class molecular chaperone
MTICKQCHGIGLAKYPGPCIDCEGTGKLDGQTCPACNGTGTWLTETLCRDCKGSGIEPSAEPRDAFRQ